MGGSPELSKIRSAISIFVIAFAAVAGAGAGTGTGTEIVASSNPNPNLNMSVFPRYNLESGFGEAQPEEPEPGDFKLQLHILPAPVYSFDVDRDEELNTLPPGLMTKKMNNANNEVIKTDADYSDPDAATDPQPQRQIQSSSPLEQQENEDNRKSNVENQVGKPNYEEQSKSKYKSTRVKSKPQKIKAEVTISGPPGENATISTDTETEAQSSKITEISTEASGVHTKSTNSSLNSILKISSSPTSFKPILAKYLTTASPTTSGKLIATPTGTATATATDTGWPQVKMNDFDSDLKIEPSATIDDANDTDTDTDTADIFEITPIHDSIYKSHFHPQNKPNTTTMNMNIYNNSSGGYYHNSNVTFNMNNVLWAGALPGPEEGGDDLPMYLRVTAFIFLLIIFAVGTIGNTMVIIVIHCSRDMRTSTNIFLVNLSVADLLVLLICTPTCIMEVYYDPQIWLLGSAMCKLVPLLEVTVAHASVLTILAISFERYYAICCPLKANYVCTKTRAISICVSTWFAAGVITSPMYFMINYYTDSNNKPRCDVGAGTLWAVIYSITSIVIFFLLPLLILLITYGLIAQNLTADRSRLKHNYTRQNLRARQQVVLMLGTVVFTFFLCLLPFRVLTMFILLSENFPFTNYEIYYNIEYFCRIMLYTNSALNPILYNIMSSKFRNGFLILCSRRRRQLSRFQRQGTFHTLTTTSSASTTSNLPNNFIHSTATATPITAEATKDRNRLRRLGLCRGGRCVCVCGYSCGCTCACSACCQNQNPNMAGHFWTGKILRNSPHSHHDLLMNKNKNVDLDLDRYSYSFTNINLNTAASPKYNQFHNYCKKCCEFEANKSRLGAKWLHKHLTLSPGGTSTATVASSALILSQSQSPGGDSAGAGAGDHHHHSPCCNNRNGNNGGNHGGKCHCHFSCSSSRTFSRGISSENNLIDKCFSLNCQICQRRRKGHILAAVQEDQNRRAKTANGMDGNGGKLTIKMAMKSNYYSCSFSSFSNTNTMETIL